MGRSSRGVSTRAELAPFHRKLEAVEEKAVTSLAANLAAAGAVAALEAHTATGHAVRARSRRRRAQADPAFQMPQALTGGEPLALARRSRSHDSSGGD